MVKLINLVVLVILMIWSSGCASRKANNTISKQAVSIIKSKNTRVYQLKMSMNDKDLKKAVSLRMYGEQGEGYESQYKNDFFIIKNAKNNKDVRRYWAYLHMTMYSVGLGNARHYIVGMPKLSSTKRTLIKAENILRLKYDIPVNKIPHPSGLKGLALSQPFSKGIERYIRTGSL